MRRISTLLVTSEISVQANAAKSWDAWCVTARGPTRDFSFCLWGLWIVNLDPRKANDDLQKVPCYGMPIFSALFAKVQPPTNLLQHCCLFSSHCLCYCGTNMLGFLCFSQLTDLPIGLMFSHHLTSIHKGLRSATFYVQSLIPQMKLFQVMVTVCCFDSHSPKAFLRFLWTILCTDVLAEWMQMYWLGCLIITCSPSPGSSSWYLMSSTCCHLNNRIVTAVGTQLNSVGPRRTFHWPSGIGMKIKLLLRIYARSY